MNDPDVIEYSWPGYSKEKLPEKARYVKESCYDDSYWLPFVCLFDIIYVTIEQTIALRSCCYELREPP